MSRSYLSYKGFKHPCAYELHLEERELSRLHDEEGITTIFVGGSPTVDEERKRYPNFWTSGNQRGADIQDDWNKPIFWEKIKLKKPRVLAVDPGSDSWLQTDPVTHLKKVISSCQSLKYLFIEITQYPSYIEALTNIKPNTETYKKNFKCN